MIFRNVVLAIIAVFLLYASFTSGTNEAFVLFVAAAVVIATGAILNKLDKIERYLKNQKSEDQKETNE